MWKSRAVPVEDKENFFSSERIPFGGGIVHTPLVKTTLVELSEIPIFRDGCPRSLLGQGQALSLRS